MRSPPHHHATLSDNKHDPASTDLNFAAAKASLLRSIPPHIAQDIVDVPARYNLHDRDAERERRLRLLIRRYVNQIQYGCHNRQCSTPSCLSYRKRNAKGPIRVQSDLSARSLASHLIQEYAAAGKDPNHGLCHNPPVVPWYRDPRVKTAPSTAPHKEQLTDHVYTNGHVKQPTQAPIPMTSSDQGTLDQASNQRRVDADKATKEGGNDTLATAYLGRGLLPPDEEAQQAGSTTGPPASSQQGGHLPQEKFDTSSFTQTLFDRAALGYDKRPSLSEDQPSKQTQYVPTSPSSDILHNTAFCGLMLQRLNWGSLLWLQVISHAMPESTNTPLQTFLQQSLFYTFSSPTRFLETTTEWKLGPSTQDAALSWHASSNLERGFRILDDLCMEPDRLLAALHQLVQSSYTSDLNLAYRRNATLLPTEKPVHVPGLLGAGSISTILSRVLLAMANHVVPGSGHDLNNHFADVIFLAWQSRGLVADHSQFARIQKLAEPDATDLKPQIKWPIFIDALNKAQLHRLSVSVMDCLSHHAVLSSMQSTSRANRQPNIAESIVDQYGEESLNDPIYRKLLGNILIYLARNVVRREWDRNPTIKRTSAVAGALELLTALYHKKVDFDLQNVSFESEFLADGLSIPQDLLTWLSFEPTGQQIHILSKPFLFPPFVLVKYFRTINARAMQRRHERAVAHYHDARQFLQHHIIPVYGHKEVLSDMRAHMARYFVLTIRRDHILDDAIDQLWRRQRREILQPLRVRLGQDDGENGTDHGGVQKEFFGLLFAEAFDPDTGIFTVDPTTHMTWFQPGSLEPLYKYEALGMLMSLAVYNGITLPITMPLAFYRKLLGLKVKKLGHIQDGWPDLANGLRLLLEYDGDVAEAIGRTYEFSYEFAGTTVTVGLLKEDRPLRVRKPSKEKGKSTAFELSPHPVEESRSRNIYDELHLPDHLMIPISLTNEPAMVTNSNRKQYVQDYITCLTDKSIHAQYSAFAKGFFTCIDSTALSLFSPEHLRTVIEGYTFIDIAELELAAKYEEYDRNSQYVTDFWTVVKGFSPDQHKKLLEFVTASDRVPVNGIASVNFTIQKNGDGDERLPESSTCYQRLLLPQYSTSAVLRERLAKALEFSMGFGNM